MRAGIYSCSLGTLFACLIGGTLLGAQQPAAIQRDGTTSATGTADAASPSAEATDAKSIQKIQLRRRCSDSLSAGATAALSRPVAAAFSVQVVPGALATAFPTDFRGEEKQAPEYRQLTLRFSMPASKVNLVQSDAGQCAARLEVIAVGYSDGRLAPSNGSDGVQVLVNFNGAADPRIAKSTLTATLTLNILEHGKSRWLLLSVRDMETEQLETRVIPMERVKMVAAH
jgi:hypothetical protein